MCRKTANGKELKDVLLEMSEQTRRVRPGEHVYSGIELETVCLNHAYEEVHRLTT